MPSRQRKATPLSRLRSEHAFQKSQMFSRRHRALGVSGLAPWPYLQQHRSGPAVRGSSPCPGAPTIDGFCMRPEDPCQCHGHRTSKLNRWPSNSSASFTIQRMGYRSNGACGRNWIRHAIVYAITRGWALVEDGTPSASMMPAGATAPTACSHTFARPKRERATVSGPSIFAATTGF
jgi:hypothetical protein